VSAELPHLQGPHKANALLSDSERIAWIRQERWIQYPRAERILYCLTDLIDYPPRDRMPSLVVYGATGMGKTRIVQKFLRDHRSRFDASRGKTRLPVVSIQMPPAPTPQDLYEEILIGMGGIFSQIPRTPCTRMPWLNGGKPPPFGRNWRSPPGGTCLHVLSNHIQQNLVQ
jgi:Cdc6-like AAA superfamily ATPase